MSINNFELEALAAYYGIHLNAVCSKDELKQLPTKGGNYIVNLQSSDAGGGTHWTALVVHGKNSVYFDSFGCVPPLEVGRFVKRSRTKSAFNGWIVQDIESELCGYYCLALFIYLKEHLNCESCFFSIVNDFISMFIDDNSKNGTILKNFYRRLPIQPNAFLKTRFLARNIK